MPMSALEHLGAVPSETRDRAAEILAAVEDAGHQIHHVWGMGSSAEHATGRALDFMVYIRNARGTATGIDSKAGDFIRDYVWTHRKRLGLIHVIWERTILSDRVEPGTIRAMKDRGNPTDNHMDHAHILFADAPYVAPGRSVPITEASHQTPRPRPSGIRQPAPRFPLPSGWYFGPKAGPRESVSGYYHRLPNGRPGHPGLLAWQLEMTERGWGPKLGRADGLYGPRTGAVALEFQRQMRLRSKDGLIGRETHDAAWEAHLP